MKRSLSINHSSMLLYSVHYEALLEIRYSQSGDTVNPNNAEYSKMESANPANMLSIRKKYRKMRIKFDEIMRMSNQFYTDEQRAVETARRLAQENE
jgi:hypothetical protein